MLILGIETSGSRCSVAMARDDKTLIEYNTEITNLHAEILGEQVEGMLGSLKIDSGELDLIAIASGPGSFTGLRIGMAYAKGMAYALEIPIISVSNFEILAYQGILNLYPIDVFIDAHLNRFYYAQFASKDNNPYDIKLIDHMAVKSILQDSVQVVVQRLMLPAFISAFGMQNRVVLGAEYFASVACEIAHKKYVTGISENLIKLEPLYLQTFAGRT